MAAPAKKLQGPMLLLLLGATAVARAVLLQAANLARHCGSSCICKAARAATWA